MADIVDRLRIHSDNEETMKVWDNIRSIIADGNRGSWPRDIFESILSHIDEEREEAADVISILRDRITKLKKALEPFAEKADIIARDHPGWNHDVFQWGAEPLVFTMKALRDARAALDQDKGSGDG